MKTIFMMIENLKKIIPYLTLIAIYFFFINLEARKQYKEKFIIEKANDSAHNKSSLNDKKERLKIPVIPYKR